MKRILTRNENFSKTIHNFTRISQYYRCVTSRASYLVNGTTTSIHNAISVNRSLSTSIPDSDVGLLKCQEKGFNSVEIDTEHMHGIDNSSDFASRLWTTLVSLKKEGRSAVYLKVNMVNAHYISIAGMYNFRFHHAHNDYCKLLLWLPEGLECKVPPFSTHHCGVGGLVLSADNKILVVQEKTKKFVGWKLPGGYVNLGEEFSDAAIREVYEETGIRTKFESILSVRHSHEVQFGRSDVYIICMLRTHRPSGEDIIKVDPEIDDAVWMPFDEFKQINRHSMIQKVLEKVHLPNALVEHTMESVVPGRKPFKLYV